MATRVANRTGFLKVRDMLGPLRHGLERDAWNCLLSGLASIVVREPGLEGSSLPRGDLIVLVTAAQTPYIHRWRASQA
jgi:hypothetical protein